MTVRVDGRPAAALRRDHERDWRARVAEAGRSLGHGRGLRLDFVLAPGRWVDLDSLVEVTVAGLRDGGVVESRPATLDALVATKREGAPTGVVLGLDDPAVLASQEPPGPAVVAVEVEALPLPGRREAKRALRGHLAAAWDERPPLQGLVWAELAVATTGSLLTPMEPALDTVEPVLGRDPRGQPRQEFFPNDDRIVWLRLRRTQPPESALRLTLGPLAP